MNIYIVAHKEVDIPNVDGYTPIQVGDKEDIFSLRDNQGENISKKNQSFCELTAAYWIWKNTNDLITGLVHYRRFFVKKILKFSQSDILDEKKIKRILRKYDLIVPQPLYLFHNNVYNHYKKIYHIEDYEKCGEIIKKKYPEYYETFKEVSNSHELVACNMMITSHDIFAEYHKWLFDILFELEECTDVSDYDDYNKRLYGFISERLFTVWIKKNKQYKIKYCPVINIENQHNTKEYIFNQMRKICLKFMGN